MSVDRQPPHNVPAEQSILGALMIDADIVDDTLSRLTADDFYQPEHRVIYAAIQRLYDQHIPLDQISVSNAIRQQSEEAFKQVGSYGYLSDLINGVAATANVGYHVGLVRDCSFRYRVISQAQRIQHAAYAGDQDLAAHCQALGDTAVASDGKRPAMTMKEAVERTIPKIEAARDGKTETLYFPVGYLDLDGLLGGVNAGEMTLVGARPSMGKTCLVLNVQMNQAEKEMPGVVFSQEMSYDQLVIRALARYAGISSQRISMGNLSEAQLEAVGVAAAHLAQLPILIDDNTEVTTSHIRSRLALAHRKFGKVSSYMVDHIGLMGEYANARDNHGVIKALGDASRRIKNMARDFNCHAFALCQLSRSVESRNSKRPLLSDLRESGNLEQNADDVWLLYRDDYYNPEASVGPYSLLDVIVAKRRNGPVGTVSLLWRPETQDYQNVAPD